MLQAGLVKIILGTITLVAPLALALDGNPLLQDNFDGEKGESVVPGRDGNAILASEPAKYAKELQIPTGADLSKGTVMFWLQPQQELSSFESRWSALLLAAENKQALEISISAKSSVQLAMSMNRQSVRFDFTHLKARKWYHAAFTWDCTKGTLDFYAGGRLYTHVETEPWQSLEPGSKLFIGAPDIAIDDFKLYGRPMNAEEIAAIAQPRPGEELADEGIQIFDETLADYPLRKELLYQNDFSGDLNDWILEGPGVTKIVDGRLYMESKDPENGHIVFWNKKDFPADFFAEWDFSPANESALYIIFFCATGRNGKDIFDPSLEKRDGTFKQYIMGDINAYHISYFRNLRIESGICNMRKEYGFHLVSIGRDPMPPVAGGQYHISLFKKGPMIRFFIDGKLCVKFDDNGKTYGPVWGEGKMGLRQMAPSKAYYDNFKVYKLVD